MAEAATYRGIHPVTVIASASGVVRGVRVTRQSNGQVTVQDASARGDYVTLQAGDSALTGKPVLAVLAQQGKVPALVTGTTTVVGDLAYAAASGQFSKTSTNATLVGRFTTATVSGALGEVELFAVA